jgi:hypothetical protein
VPLCGPALARAGFWRLRRRRARPQAPLHHAGGRLFFEWKAIKGQRAKQPYAIAMKYGAPFAG